MQGNQLRKALFIISVVFLQASQCQGREIGEPIFPKSNSLFSTNTKGRFRESRLFRFFVNFNSDWCMTDTLERGVCTKSSKCKKEGGTSGGSCAQGFGTCCLFTKACSKEVQTVTNNVTRLTQQITGDLVDSCRYSIPKQKDVCQIRLDFIDFNIDEGPDAKEGLCSTDTFGISGNVNGALGPLCGNLDDQHMYLDYGQNTNINLEVSLASNKGQTWDIMVTMIKCDSSEKAPEGCLQYFTGQRGKVKSFNFKNKHQLNDQDYTVCVRSNPGMKKITWKPCTSDIKDFYMSGGQPALCGPNSAVGCKPFGIPGNGTDCGNDWVMIYGDNKYCGSGLPTPPVSTTQPFLMQVHFDNAESPMGAPVTDIDVENSGFCLMYSQSAF